MCVHRPPATDRPGRHPLTVDVLWLCRCWHVALVALCWTPSGTAGSAPDTTWHSWFCTGLWAAQLAWHRMLGSTAGSTLDAVWHSWLCICPIQTRPKVPGALGCTQGCSVWPRLLLAHAEGWLLGTSGFLVLTFSCFYSRLLLVLALSNSISPELQSPAPMASTKNQ